nr:unnamed protein product [Callosobruchus analis]
MEKTLKFVYFWHHLFDPRLKLILPVFGAILLIYHVSNTSSMGSAEKLLSVNFEVFGRVQGVFFRKMEEENSYDPYVREQQMLRCLFEEVSSGEEDLQEPFEDDGEFGSDENYVPSETELEQSSSDADDQNPDSDHEGSDSSPGEERFDENDSVHKRKDKYGIKFIELATSDGYVLNIEMYSGAEHKDVNMTKTTALVLRLLKPYLMKGHDVFMDNYYNSVELSEKLLNLRTHTNGILRSNRRGNPKQLVKKKLKKGEHFWLPKKYVYISKWKDKRDVLMITTRNHPQLITSKNRFGKEKVKPEEVVVYNDHMSGIDRCDQMTSTYCSPRKTIRWYKKRYL